MNTVYVNFYGLLSAAETADRIEDAYRRSLQGRRGTSPLRPPGRGGHVHGEGDQLEIVDPVFALWVTDGRQGFGEPLDDLDA